MHNWFLAWRQALITCIVEVFTFWMIEVHVLPRGKKQSNAEYQRSTCIKSLTCFFISFCLVAWAASPLVKRVFRPWSIVLLGFLLFLSRSRITAYSMRAASKTGLVNNACLTPTAIRTKYKEYTHHEVQVHRVQAGGDWRQLPGNREMLGDACMQSLE